MISRYILILLMSTVPWVGAIFGIEYPEPWNMFVFPAYVMALIIFGTRMIPKLPEFAFFTTCSSTSIGMAIWVSDCRFNCDLNTDGPLFAHLIVAVITSLMLGSIFVGAGMVRSFFARNNT